MARKLDAVVIGAGPGGYPCAIRLAQLGKKVAIVDRGPLGGVCLNWGCIPSKAVIHAADVRDEMSHASSMGITVQGEPGLDIEKLRGWKQGIVKKLTGGIGQLLKANGVEHVQGTARLASATKVVVEKDGKTVDEIEASAIVIATGGRPIELPFLKGSRIWTSKEALELNEIPKRLAIVGGGVIGLELGCAFQKLGTKELTVVEMLPDLLPGTDPDFVRPVRRKLKDRGANILTEAKASAYREDANGAVLTVETKEGPKEIACDKVLVAIGFKPNSEGIGLSDAGVALDKRGHVIVNAHCRSNVPSVYAIGDVTGAPYLAHRATKMGTVAAEVIAGKPAAFDVQAMPAAIFTDPEIATVGIQEHDAKTQNRKVKVGKFPYSVLGRALAGDATEGLAKVISDADTGLLLGVGVAGSRASDLIAEAALAIEMGAQAEDLALTVHAHPTFPELLLEAAEDALGHAIHIAPRKERAAASH